MALNENNALSLLRKQEDQIASQFIARFPKGIPQQDGTFNTDIGEEISLRVNGAFTQPEVKIFTYEKFHRGMKAICSGAKDDSDKTFALEIICDQDWNVYTVLRNWLDAIYNPNTGSRNFAGDSYTFLRIDALGNKGLNDIKRSIIIDGIRINSLGITDFDNSNGEPIKVKVGFVFTSYQVLTKDKADSYISEFVNSTGV